MARVVVRLAAAAFDGGIVGMLGLLEDGAQLQIAINRPGRFDDACCGALARFYGANAVGSG